MDDAVASDANGTSPSAITSGFRARLRPTVASEELDGELVIYDDERGVLHRLNPSATAVFVRLDGTATVDEIGAELAEAYGLEPGAIAGAVLGIVREFGARHLLTDVVGTSSIEEPDAHGE